MKNKKFTTISNGFVFKSKCKLCGTPPCGNVYKGLGQKDWANPKKFQSANVEPPCDYFLREQISNVDQFRYLSYTPHNMGVSFFKNKSLLENQNLNRTISCKCGMTWWSYKNVSYTYSTKLIKFK